VLLAFCLAFQQMIDVVFLLMIRRSHTHRI